jgi:hypothetical protein
VYAEQEETRLRRAREKSVEGKEMREEGAPRKRQRTKATREAKRLGRLKRLWAVRPTAMVIGYGGSRRTLEKYSSTNFCMVEYPLCPLPLFPRPNPEDYQGLPRTTGN